MDDRLAKWLYERYAEPQGALPPWDALPTMATMFWLAEADDIEAAVGRPEWKCPNCGAVTRARMADH